MEISVLRIAIWLFVLLGLIDIIRGIFKKRGIYTFKKQINGLRPFVSFIWIAFFTLGAVALTPIVIEWTDTIIIKYSTDPNSYFVLSLIPLVWIATIFYIAISIASGSCKPIWGYTEKEATWRKEEKVKNLEKLYKYLPFMERFNKHLK